MSEWRAASIPASDEIISCVIVTGEIMFGIESAPIGRKRRELETMAKNAFLSIRCVEVPVSAAIEYSKIKLIRKKAGRPILENDLWIASTAMAINAVLVSHDNDMQGIPGLTVEDWW